MVEKRSDYRKRQKKSLLSKLKSSFSDNDSEEVDVNPDFKRDDSEEEPRRRPLAGDGQEFYQHNQSSDKETIRQEKSLRLKKRLNRAILIVIVLIILVLLALFHL
ncbi:hypothetical protein AAA431_06485 [Lactobacillus crispatus]|jgi:hypothetical protein|uniref:Uncharacterized protein n=1 Tax=Lactobacillus crispatus TaxID=47770 RepID=A0A109DF97_9LACO|nr:hypothetical protein [Lactobacillus crispatus]EEX30377.1 hypothetical protein HMPREF0508_00170 [Lactobacillus crispatus MV-3A-US]KAB1977707.1 hypothetical protein F8251_02500 [Lactobacillus crispatus]KWU04382.1 hypothetical protein AEL95_03160 [Lactobacillus crispatus]MBG0732428.1 hypothetical protein [Lactobacillus crispatus]MBI1712096.1 hypothetical protein [Lactobacillus crispatus]